MLGELSGRGWVCEGIGPVFVGKRLAGCIIERIVILVSPFATDVERFRISHVT